MAARVAKERTSLALFEKLRVQTGTLAELHRWLFAEHDAYRAGQRSPSLRVDTTTY
jgi:hypothetical protein